MAKTISFGGMTNADLEAQQLELERRQAMIDAIRKSAIDPIQQQQVSGHVVPISGWEGLAKLGQAYLARRGEKKVSEEKQALASELSTRAANALRSLAPEGTFDPTYTGPMSRTPAGAPASAQSTQNKELWTRALAAYQSDPEMGRSVISSLLTPTTEQRNMAAQGIDPELMGALRIAEARKNGMLEMSPNSTAVNMMDNSRMVAPDFASGIYGGFDQNGTPRLGGIPGNQVIPQMAGATRAAEQEATARFNMMPVDTQAGPVLMSAEQAARQAGSTGGGNGTVGIPLQTNAQRIAAEEAAKLEASRAATAPQAASQLAGQMRKTDLVNQYIDKAIAEAGPVTTGIVGSALSGIPGTPAHDISKTLKTIESFISFDALNEMRQNSPTGAALGAVQVAELELLASSLGSLAQSQGPEQFKQNLATIKEQINATVNGSQQRFDAMYQNTPQVDDLLKKYGVK